MKSESKSFSAVHKAAGESELDLCTALDTCVHAEKIRELVVNEKSSLRLTKYSKYSKVNNCREREVFTQGTHNCRAHDSLGLHCASVLLQVVQPSIF